MPRYAKKNTVQDLDDFFRQIARNFNYDSDEPSDMPYDMYMLEEIIPEKDFKVRFDFENQSFPWMNNFGQVGYHQMNGFAIALCCAGGDWESPVHFALYVDDKNKLRCYIPMYGNVFNIYCMTAFGSEGEYGERNPEDYMPKELNDDDEEEYNSYMETVENSENLDMMLSDIANRICIKGNNVVPLPPGITFPYYKGIKPKRRR